MVLVADHVRTAAAKGLSCRRLIRRRAAPAGYSSPASLLQALALWAAAMIVVVSALADLALVLLDPRVRASGRPVG